MKLVKRIYGARLPLAAQREALNQARLAAQKESAAATKIWDKMDPDYRICRCEAAMHRLAAFEAANGKIRLWSWQRPSWGWQRPAW